MDPGLRRYQMHISPLERFSGSNVARRRLGGFQMESPTGFFDSIPNPRSPKTEVWASDSGEGRGPWRRPRSSRKKGSAPDPGLVPAGGRRRDGARASPAAVAGVAS